MLSETDKDAILSNFPPIKLCFESLVHKTVSTFDFEIAIPSGVKHFAQFTVFNKKPVCILMEICRNNQISNIESIQTKFSAKLIDQGKSIFYGTKFRKNGSTFFCIEDVFFYKGKDVTAKPFIDKLGILKNIFANKEIEQIKNQIVFGLPVIGTMTNKCDFQNVSYHIHAVHYRFLNKNTVIHTKYKILPQENVVFKIMPDIQNDIYNLFALDEEGKEIFYDIADIPTYKTSVFMNSLFRSIKENANLDSLEESDDEEEFENTNIDKFVNLGKSHNMLCIFNSKHKKWTPTSISTDPVISVQKLKISK
jgi:hypothetical protein